MKMMVSSATRFRNDNGLFYNGLPKSSLKTLVFILIKCALPMLNIFVDRKVPNTN